MLLVKLNSVFSFKEIQLETEDDIVGYVAFLQNQSDMPCLNGATQSLVDVSNLSFRGN